MQVRSTPAGEAFHYDLLQPLLARGTPRNVQHARNESTQKFLLHLIQLTAVVLKLGQGSKVNRMVSELHSSNGVGIYLHLRHTRADLLRSVILPRLIVSYTRGNRQQGCGQDYQEENHQRRHKI
jgi:hypothetical protein